MRWPMPARCLFFQHIGTWGVAERREARGAYWWRIDALARVAVEPCIPLQPPRPVFGRRVALPFIRTERAAAGLTDADAEVAVWVAGLADDARVVAAGCQHEG